MATDPIAVVEAAYDLSGHERTWVEGIVRAMQPLLDRGMGAFGYVIDTRARQITDETFVAAGGTDDVRTAVLGFHGEASSDDFRAGYDVSPRTLSSIFGPTFGEQPITRRWMHAFGMRDCVVCPAMDLDGVGVGLGAPLPREDRATRELRRIGPRATRHIVAGLRLRRRLGASQAVLTPGGAVVHAVDAAKSKDAREALREAAIAQEKARGATRRRDPDAALDLWRGLVAGRWSLVERFEHDGRRFLVAYENAPEIAETRTLTPTEARVATLIALGHPLKLVAYELGVSIGTVSTHLSRAMTKLGAGSRAELVRWFGGMQASRP